MCVFTWEGLGVARHFHTGAGRFFDQVDRRPACVQHRNLGQPSAFVRQHATERLRGSEMAEGQTTLLTFANDGPGGLVTHKHFESHILVPPKIPQFSQCLPFPTQDLGMKHRMVCACARAGSGWEDVACSQSCNAHHHAMRHTRTWHCTQTKTRLRAPHRHRRVCA